MKDVLFREKVMMMMMMMAHLNHRSKGSPFLHALMKVERCIWQFRYLSGALSNAIEIFSNAAS